MEFIKPSIENAEELRRILKCNEYRCCDFSTGTLILWGDYYGYTYTVIRDFFVIWMTDFKAFSFPMYVGEKMLNVDELRKGESEVVKELMHFFEDQGERPRFLLLSVEQSKRLEELYPGHFEFSDNEDYRDYIYNTEDLAELAGRHYHGKRNHIYRFEEAYPEYKVEDITTENIESCKKVEESWTDYEMGDERAVNVDRSDTIEVESGEKNAEAIGDESGDKQDDESNELQYEKKTIFYALDHMKELGLEGCVIRIPDTASESGFRTAAFAIGERLTDDCFVVHFEKADRKVREAYAVVNREFARKLKGRYKYINREEDMGLEGLRKAKKSYHPVFMCHKISAIEKESC